MDKVDMDRDTRLATILAGLASDIRNRCTCHRFLAGVLRDRFVSIWQHQVLGDGFPSTTVLFVTRFLLEVRQAHVLSRFVSSHTGNTKVQRRRLSTTYGAIPKSHT